MSAAGVERFGPAGQRANIPFTGTADRGFGLALWQADGTGPEPAAVGHAFDTPIGRITSHYYAASRDYAGIDPRARGGLQAQAPLSGLPRLAEALHLAGLTAADLVLRLPLITPGSDREGVDWWYRDAVETRHLRPSAPIPLLVGGVVGAQLAVTTLILTEDYRGVASFADARLSLVSEPFALLPVATDTPAVDRVITAWRQDLNDRKLRFVAERIVLSGDGFFGRGRTNGYFADIPSAWLEVVPADAP